MPLRYVLPIIATTGFLALAGYLAYAATAGDQPFAALGAVGAGIAALVSAEVPPRRGDE